MKKPYYLIIGQQSRNSMMLTFPFERQGNPRVFTDESEAIKVAKILSATVSIKSIWVEMSYPSSYEKRGKVVWGAAR